MTPLTSLQNPRVKDAVRLRERGARDAAGRMLIEGYRETRRALDNHIRPTCFFYCPELFQGGNEPELLRRAADAGAELLECSAPVFRKLSYRDRPDGLLALAPQWRRGLNDLSLPENPLLLVMERIEKPGNLGTMLRTADAGGVDAVIVCDKCTDLFNPNVIRASIGTIFCVPTVEAATPETLDWLRARVGHRRRRRAVRTFGPLDEGNGCAGAHPHARPVRLAQRRRRRHHPGVRSRAPAAGRQGLARMGPVHIPPRGGGVPGKMYSGEFADSVIFAERFKVPIHRSDRR